MLNSLILATSLAVTPVSDSDDNIWCQTVAGSAGTIMIHRQYVNDLLKILTIPDLSPTLAAMAVMAYDSPRFSADETRADAITDFSNEALHACLQ